MNANRTSEAENNCPRDQPKPSEQKRSQKLTVTSVADQREFLKICQAVGMGFLVMGVIGYVVKLGMWKISGRGERPGTHDMLTPGQYTFQ